MFFEFHTKLMRLPETERRLITDNIEKGNFDVVRSLAKKHGIKLVRDLRPDVQLATSRCFCQLRDMMLEAKSDSK